MAPETGRAAKARRPRRGALQAPASPGCGPALRRRGATARRDARRLRRRPRPPAAVPPRR
eukprot:2944679-Lingulodinium_polyedra.AAC.1